MTETQDVQRPEEEPRSTFQTGERRRRALLLAVFFAFFLLLHMRMNYTSGDYGVFRDEPDTYETLFHWLKFRWDTWSSRLLVETALSFLTSGPPAVWVILNCLLYTHLTYLLARLIGGKNFTRTLAITILLVLIYPFLEMREAGWMATTLNYLWPFYFFVLVLVRLKKLYAGKKLSVPEGVLYSLCMLFATNVEQMVVFAGIVLFLVILVFFRGGREIGFLMFLEGIVLFSLTMAMICPGNPARNSYEVGRQFWDFGNLDVFQRFHLGVSLTFQYLFYGKSLPFVAFSTILATEVLSKKDALFIEKAISLIPLVITLVFGILPFLIRELAGVEPGFGYRSGRYGFIEPTNYGSIATYVPVILIAFVLASILISLLALFENKKAVWIFALFVTGCVTSMVLGFSSTAWFSRNRVHFFLNFAVIFCTLLLLKREVLLSEKPIRMREELRRGNLTQKALWTVLPTVAAVSALVMMIEM